MSRLTWDTLARRVVEYEEAWRNTNQLPNEMVVAFGRAISRDVNTREVKSSEPAIGFKCQNPTCGAIRWGCKAATDKGGN